jgi:GTP cyclohydrolase I
LVARHICVEMRGVREVAPLTRASFWRGEYEEYADLRAEFFTACGLKK